MDSYTTTYDTPRSTAFELAPRVSALISEETAPLAHPVKRLGARLLDIVLMLVSFLPGLLLISTAETTAQGAEDLAVALGVLLMLGGALGMVAYQALLLGREGQTVGKRALNLRVVDHNDGSNPGFARAVVVREMLTAILNLFPFFGLADAAFILGAERRCIHDHLASTSVVDEGNLVDQRAPGLY